jgi:sugar transferase (PEP-CTERM system associated)
MSQPLNDASLQRPMRGRLELQSWSVLPVDALTYTGALLLGLAASKSIRGVLPPVWASTVDVVFIIAFALSLVAVNSAIGLYSRGERGPESAVLRAVSAGLLGTLIIYLAIRALTPPMPLRWDVPFPLLPYALLVATLRPLLYGLQQSQIGQRRVLILGNGPDARAIWERLSHDRQGAVRVVGMLPAGAEAGAELTGTAVFDPQTNLWDLVARLRVNEVIVAAREQRGGMLPLRELLECRIHGVRITDQTAFFERVHGEFPLESLKASWLIYGHGFEQTFARRFAKRSTDVLASLLLLALALPVMALTALAIRLESPGPVIYRQERVGRGGRCFQVLKFRSMRADAERDGVARWANAGDARVTRVGRLIRKARIDELPQLLNVLRGQMSIVGPRPERPTFVDQLKRDLRFYDVRHSIKPGLTGWAQVRFNYAASLEDTRRKLQFDLYYVKNHSLLLDLRILFETVRVVLRGEGAR